MELEAPFGSWVLKYMVGMKKTRGIPQADEEFLDSVASGQEPYSPGVLGTNDLGTEPLSSKALEGIPGVATKTNIVTVTATKTGTKTLALHTHPTVFFVTALITIILPHS